MGLLAQPQPAQPQGRKASPQEQQQYKTMVMQVMKFLTKPKVRELLKASIEKVGPEQALAMIIGQAIGMSGKAAQQSGVKLQGHTATAAIKEIVTALVSMLAASGIVKDVQQTVAAVMQLLNGAPQAPQPQMQPQGV